MAEHDPGCWARRAVEGVSHYAGPAALAAVAPGGFRGALGGDANVQGSPPPSAARLMDCQVYGRSFGQPFRTSSPLLDCSEGDSRAITVHPEMIRVPSPALRQCSVATPSWQERGGHVEQSSQPHLPIGGPSGLLTKPQLWKPRDRNASMLRYGLTMHAQLSAHANQARPRRRHACGASASLLSFGTPATSESPSVLAVSAPATPS
ncbi:hypothetical protein BJ912DRAFT_95862 [Pholiota molesta]|nr:hypothetical protein BJ912DRAFT_95862 [Pholiota molesta]